MLNMLGNLVVLAANPPAARPSVRRKAIRGDLREKVTAFTLIGKIVAPSELVPVLQRLTTQKRRVDEVAALPPERQRAWNHAVGRNLSIDRYRAEATRGATLAAARGRTPEAVDDPDPVDGSWSTTNSTRCSARSRPTRGVAHDPHHVGGRRADQRGARTPARRRPRQTSPGPHPPHRATGRPLDDQRRAARLPPRLLGRHAAARPARSGPHPRRDHRNATRDRPGPDHAAGNLVAGLQRPGHRRRRSCQPRPPCRDPPSRSPPDARAPWSPASTRAPNRPPLTERSAPRRVSLAS
jgi:hypothetical protein